MPSLDPFVSVEARRDGPTLVQADPDTLGAGASDWVAAHRENLRGLVAEHGGIVVRGLGLATAGQVGEVFGILGSDLMSDEEAFAQRRQYADGVYSSAAWPDAQQMCMHHELSYRWVVPTLALFACLAAPAQGGATGLADASAVLEALPADVLQRFERHGWLLSRTYGGDIGPSVGAAFGTDDRAAVEAYCADNRIEFEWQPGGELRTRQRRPAVVRHPVSGRRCWFNQVAFLSEWTIDPEIREFMLDMYGAEGLPFTTSFGDGEPITEDVIALLNQIYEAQTVREPWQAGDLMLVDNIATAHSREPFEGTREVLVALADPRRLDELAPDFGWGRS